MVSRVDELEAWVRGNAWLLGVLEAVRDVGPPGAWVGAGAVRDVVWDGLHDGFDPRRVKDVDVCFFDAADLSKDSETQAEASLCRRLPDVEWDVKNQARVHHWYERVFGRPVRPLTSVEDGVATWPETATAVAVRLRPDGGLEAIAPLGLDDLLDGVCRRNPRRVSIADFERRVAGKRVVQRWPRVRVLYDLAEPWSNVTVRRADEADLTELMDLFGEAVRWLAGRGIDLWQEGIDPGAVSGGIARGEVYVATMDGQVVGTLHLLWSDPKFWGRRPADAGYVHRLAVSRDVAGLGRALLGWTERQVALSGRPFVRLDCAGHVTGLRRYYETAGYEHRGDVELGWPTPTSLYEKRLPPVDTVPKRAGNHNAIHLQHGRPCDDRG